MIDYSSRRKFIQYEKMCVNGVDIESVEEYKYLCTVLDNKLSFPPNTDILCKRGSKDCITWGNKGHFMWTRH